MKKFRSFGLTVFLVGAFLLGNSFVLSDSYAARSSSGGSSRSSSSGSSRASSSGFSKPASNPGSAVFGSRSGGGFFGGGSDSGKESGGFSKPSSPAVQQPPQSPQSGGFRKPTGEPSPSVQQPGRSEKPTRPSKPSASDSGGFAKPGAPQSPTQALKSGSGTSTAALAGSKFDQKMAQDMKQQKANESLKAYKAEQEKFKSPAPAGAIPRDSYANNPVYNRTKSYGGFDYNSHYSRRDDYYRSSGWNPPPYVYYSQPRFGMWDALILWSILDHVHDRNHVALAHHQANDPGYQQWRKEAEKQAETNTELKAKLAKLDAELEKMKDQPRDPSYLPKGVPAEVAISADALKEKTPEKPKLRIATGSEMGNYFFYGKLLKKHATTLDVEVVPTAGSVENLRKMIAGEVDMAIVQSDVLALLGKEFPGSKLITEQASLYNEAVQMVANTGSGINEVNDLRPGKHTVYIGPEGSGTAKTWEGFVLQDPGYKGIKTAHASYEEALKNVIRDPNSVMMFVSGLNNTYLRAADALAKETGKLHLVAVNDWNFNDKYDDNGNRIYEFVSIGSNVYPNLQKGLLWGSNAVETISVQAVAVVRTEWVKQFGSEAMDSLSFAIMESSPEIAKKVNGLE